MTKQHPLDNKNCSPKGNFLKKYDYKKNDLLRQTQKTKAVTRWYIYIYIYIYMKINKLHRKFILVADNDIRLFLLKKADAKVTKNIEIDIHLKNSPTSPVR